MQIPGALPDALKVWWVSASPLAFLFAGRILWEKTIWTWSRGPQMVGFALWHIHPGFAVAGTLCSFAVALWLLIAIPYAVVRRRDIKPWDWLMMAASVMVVVALLFPIPFLQPVNERYRLFTSTTRAEHAQPDQGQMRSGWIERSVSPASLPNTRTMSIL